MRLLISHLEVGVNVAKARLKVDGREVGEARQDAALDVRKLAEGEVRVEM